MTWSDHAPITRTVTSPLFRPRTTHWHLNETLFSNMTLVKDAHTTLTQYFMENTMAKTPAAIIWEAHKCTIQGFFLARDITLKKSRETAIRDLTDKIQDLETPHKTANTLDTYQELADVRGQLPSLLRQHHQHSLQHTKAFFYINSDKCDKLLATLINKKWNKTYITGLRDTQGQPQRMPTRIAKVARDYFKNLY
ncbi:Hypothetical predicted protein [Pelobates cultripes]|uniref:Reverse transcriptase n=1 Tax=Pelobates cultripes TaxID=61616 RepID=A0AAD1W5N6_PELCU|nr:Hypothetical predicted protein [Pelobates cultripes]